MVVAVGPVQFYGSNLPRPRYISGSRVNPPDSVLDPFLLWASEAHWSMGGLSFNRLRLQGRVEGNVEKLRKEREKKIVKRKNPSLSLIGKTSNSFDVGAQPASIAGKRKRVLVLGDDSEDEELDQQKCKNGRKKGGDFESVSKSPSVARRSSRLIKG